MKNTIAALFAMLFPVIVFAGDIALSFDDALFFLTSRHIDQESIKRIKSYTNEGFHLANHNHIIRRQLTWPYCCNCSRQRNG